MVAFQHCVLWRNGNSLGLIRWEANWRSIGKGNWNVTFEIWYNIKHFSYNLDFLRQTSFSFSAFLFWGDFTCWLLWRDGNSLALIRWKANWHLIGKGNWDVLFEQSFRKAKGYCCKRFASHRITMGPKTILKSNWIIFVILRFFQALDLCRTQCKELRRYFFQIKRLSRFFSIC